MGLQVQFLYISVLDIFFKFINFDINQFYIKFCIYHEPNVLVKIFQIPDSAKVLCLKEDHIKSTHMKLSEILATYERRKSEISEIILPLMKPFLGRVDEAIKPGFTMLTWSSLNADSCEHIFTGCLIFSIIGVDLNGFMRPKVFLCI